MAIFLDLKKKIQKLGMRLPISFFIGLLLFSGFQNCSQQNFSSLSHQAEFSSLLGQSHNSLSRGQPPVNFYSQDRLGTNINCNYWNMNEAALNDCVKDLELSKDLGFGSVRIGLHWYMLTETDGYTLAPWKINFIKQYLNAARNRGLKILFTVNLEAPVDAYNCASVQKKPIKASSRLDFCDHIFSKYFSNLMDLILPYTPYIEVFNEINWAYDKAAPYYGALNIEDYILGRSKDIYVIAKNILEQKKGLGYSYVVLSQGISYFYDHGFSQRGWSSYDQPLISAVDYLYSMKHGYQPKGKNIYDDVIDIVAFHPYFNGSDYNDLVNHFLNKANQYSAVGKKTLWITETNSAAAAFESEKIAVFNSLKNFLETDAVQKAFWFATRVGQVGDVAHPDSKFGIYDYEHRLQYPQLAEVIKNYNAQIPESVRFLPPEFRNSIGDINTPTRVGEAAVCGIAVGISSKEQPTSNLCRVGSASDVAVVGSQFRWTCFGVNGGDNVSCTAIKLVDKPLPKPVDGVCGSATGIKFSSVPSADLCLTGKASVVVFANTVFQWSCSGFDGGATQQCSASYKVDDPSCKMQATNGTLKFDGSVEKFGSVFWEITNAQAAEYQCLEGASYIENGQLGPSQSLGLRGAVNAKATLSCKITAITKLDGSKASVDLFSGCMATATMTKLDVPSPTCEMSAENGQRDSNGAISKYGKIIWKITHAREAEYYCKEGGTYEDRGKMGPGQELGLAGFVNTKNTIDCKITSITKLDGTIIKTPFFCGATSLFF